MMRNYFHIAFLIFAFGVLITPTHSLACEKMSGNSEMSCCKKIKVADNHKKNCCAKKDVSKKHSTQNPKDNSKKDCGDCDQSSCSCAPNCFSFTLPTTFYLKNKTFNPSKVIVKTSYTGTYLSSGFLSIWLPPKLV